MISLFPRATASLCLALAFASPTPLAAQATTALAPTDAQTEEIVVTARRTGIPVWRVAGPTGTAVLVGSIGSVAPGTKWDPLPLDAALAKADRVMFPESMGVSNFGLFSVIGAIGKWRKQATLPNGQTLQAMTTPAQWARLVALRNKGVLKPGFERRHPYHLAMTLNGMVRSKAKMAEGADAYVRRFVSKNKAKRVPLAKIDFKALMAEFFKTPPRAHVACMMDAVTRAEAGAAGTRARSDAVAARSAAWAARRVPDALAAKPDTGERSCWPNGTRFEAAQEASLSPTVAGLLKKPQVTLAVMSLESLGEPGGVLDDLVAAGFDVSGPKWKR